MQCAYVSLSSIAQELKDAIDEIMPELRKENARVFYITETPVSEGTETFLDKVKAASCDSVPKSLRSFVGGTTLAMYIYTSGTTGNVSPAIWS